MPNVSLVSITVDAGLNPRAAGLNSETVADYSAAMRDGVEFPPLVIYRDGKTLWLSEGFHRAAAYSDANVSEVEVEVRTGDRTAALLNAVASNQAHGLKRTNADKRLAVELCLKACPNWTDEKVAGHCGVSINMVSQTRASLAVEFSSDENSEIDDSSNSNDDTGAEVLPNRTGRKPTKATNAQKAAKLILKDTTRSNEDIAEELGCNRNTVKIARDALEKKGRISTNTGKGKPEPVSQPGDDANENTTPIQTKRKDRATDDPAPDPRFMVNAREAADYAEKMRSLKARLESVRAEFRKVFPDRNHVLAKRIDSARWEATIGELVDTLGNNLPDCVCPPCYGMGIDPESAGTCKYCDGYGIVDAGHHSGLKARWNRTRPAFDSLIRQAEGGGQY